MEITLNGAAHPLEDGQSVADLVAALNLSQQAIAVAVNRSIVTATAGRNINCSSTIKSMLCVPLVAVDKLVGGSGLS